MRPGEIFALTWGEMASTYVNIRRRVHRGVIDSPRTEQSFRKAALSEGLLHEMEEWRHQGKRGFLAVWTKRGLMCW
jgi:hypothetical protein